MPPITVPLRTPELGEGLWLQGPEVSLRFAKGGVILVELWDATCIHCLHTLPHVDAWHRRYGDHGLITVGVHTPEFTPSQDPAVPRAVMAEMGLTYPVLHDPERETWRQFANHYWPARYLVDSRGYLRYEHFGEGAYGATEAWIRRLLVEAGAAELPAPIEPDAAEPDAVEPPAATDARRPPGPRPTAELYLGWHRGRLLAQEGYRPGEVVEHSGETRGVLAPGGFGATGRWLHEAEFLESRSAGAELEVIAEAAAVHLVVASADGEDSAGEDSAGEDSASEDPGGTVEVQAVSGAPEGDEVPGPPTRERRELRLTRTWDRPRLVTLVPETGPVEDAPFRRWHLRLRFPQVGARVYAVSFSGPGSGYSSCDPADSAACWLVGG